MASHEAVILFATGFEEIEAITVLDVLRRAEVKITSASITETREVIGGHGIRIVADVTLADIQNDLIDMIILPGGAEGVKNITESSLAREITNKSKKIAAICAAPSALSAWGAKNNTTMTSYPSFRAQVEAGGVNYSEERVVVDKEYITSRGPGTAMEFALKLVEILRDSGTSDKIAEQMLVKG